MKGKTIPEEIKTKIIGLIKEGRSVIELAREYGISPNTIYRWLGSQTRSSGDALIIAKLKREKQELIELLGKMTLFLERSKKKSKDQD